MFFHNFAKQLCLVHCSVLLSAGRLGLDTLFKLPLYIQKLWMFFPPICHQHCKQFSDRNIIRQSDTFSSHLISVNWSVGMSQIVADINGYVCPPQTPRDGPIFLCS